MRQQKFEAALKAALVRIAQESTQERYDEGMSAHYDKDYNGMMAHATKLLEALSDVRDILDEALK